MSGIINDISQDFILDFLDSLYAMKSDKTNAMIVIRTLIETISWLQYDLDTKYLDNTLVLTNNITSEVFLDNIYWNKNYRNYETVNNHIIWNSYSALPNYHLGFSTHWLHLYPSNWMEDYYTNKKDSWFFWIFDPELLFKIKFYGYQNLNYHINYISPQYLKHYEYFGKTFIGTDLEYFISALNLNILNFTRPNIDTNTNGLFFHWYEHYGSFDIVFKVSFAYWWQMILPDVNTYQCITATNIFPDIPYHRDFWWLQRKAWINDHTEIDLNLLYGSTYEYVSHFDQMNSNIGIQINSYQSWLNYVYGKDSDSEALFHKYLRDFEKRRTYFAQIYSWLGCLHTHPDLDTEYIPYNIFLSSDELDFSKNTLKPYAMCKVSGEIVQNEIDMVS